MARSKYIWVIFDSKDREVVGVFTVKHEMISWVQKHEQAGQVNRKHWKLYKAEDGQYQVPYGCRLQDLGG